jgi:hypothetical protein
MRNKNLKDNIYQEGTFITAKDNPELRLVITKYCQRIYYCSDFADESRRFAYFEHNLIAPLTQTTK